jgi:hypothetical protein
VTAYQLVNFDEFSPEGRYIGKQKAVAPVAPVETVKEVAETV